VRPWEKKDGGGEQAIWLRIATAAITAAGGIVPDEVVEVKNEEGLIQHTTHLKDSEYTYINLAPGDTVFIKRKDFPKEADREEAKE
jgi:hypothetical protein